MPSTYTTNLGIEKIATGEQSGTWGDTTNTNLDLVDQAVNGVETVVLTATGSTGSPNVIPITDGAVSSGRNKYLSIDSATDLGGTAYIQLTPNTAEKVCIIQNSLAGSRQLTVIQGTYSPSNVYTIPANSTAQLVFNGGGTGAIVRRIDSYLPVQTVTPSGYVVTQDTLFSGEVTYQNTTDGVTFNDGVDLKIGTSGDMQIVHDGSNSLIRDFGTGGIRIQGDDIKIQNGSGADLIESTTTSVIINYAGTPRITTGTTGNSLTGLTTMASASVSGSLTLGLWELKVVSNELVFEYNGTDVFKIGTNGAITSADDITAFGTV